MAAGSKARDLVVRLLGLIHGYLAGKIRPRELSKELRAVADWIDGGAQPEPAPVTEITTQREQEVFEYWQKTFGKRGAKFTADRRSRVRARLREGYELEALRLAIDGCAASPFHRGENRSNQEYTDLVLICQSGSKLEQFAAMGGWKPARSGGQDTSEEIERLAAEADEQLKQGRTDAYNQTQARIRAIGDTRRTRTGGAG